MELYLQIQTAHVSGIIVAVLGDVTQVPSVRLLTLLSGWKTQLSLALTSEKRKVKNMDSSTNSLGE